MLSSPYILKTNQKAQALQHSKPSVTVMGIQLEQDEETVTAETPMLKKILLESTLNVPMMMPSSGGYDQNVDYHI
jgi:hypothetical protein